ncbi:MAG TPA: DUF3658 domain-containing protein [Chitinophagaceae bacterium]|nr:DUF3658 domain-containing protein [Chitinophagaceae bacterium]
MIHVVFQANDVDTLEKVTALDESLAGKIVLIKDDYAVGPIAGIYSQQGIDERKNWWKDVLAGGDYEGLVESGEVDDVSTVASLMDELRANKDEAAWIWAAPNQHDISGYYWLISQLKDFQGRIFILYLNNLPFINQKGHIFYPANIFDIPPKEFLKAKKLNRPVSLAEFETDTDDWTRLCNENKGIRILEGGKKLLQHDYDFYDKELLRIISHDWQKASKVLHTFFSKSKILTGDAFLLWRIRLMINENKIEAQGDIKNRRDFEVKTKSLETII